MADTFAIDRIGHRGDGIAHVNGRPAFVPLALPGEVVEAEPLPGAPERWQLTRIVKASRERIAPFCTHFGTCGGCAIQHWQDAAYRRWKGGLVVEALAQAGVSCAVDDLIDAHGAGRRRVVIHARRGSGDRLAVGFAAAGRHAIVDIDHCPVLAPQLAPAFTIARDLAQALAPLAKPLDIQITATDAGLDVDVRGSGPPSATVTLALSQLAARRRLARLTRHGDMVAMHAPPHLTMGTATVRLPPAAFLQATASGEATLAALVTEHCGKAKHIADLFCGVGPFALRLAERARITAIDADAPAVVALRQAAAATRGLKPIMAETRDLFRRPLWPQELAAFEAVVFDPPRQGAEAQARQLAASRVPRIVAVSCNAATFARDARLLIDGGYRLSRVTPVDQFRHTPHVELVACFERQT
ncbi:MAG: class I SAM-dependent RNA methyltransferase [Xanthobacteraceae bacterium]